MRIALLIAWREFAENARTKGFWVSLFLFPTILILSIQVPILLEKKGTPTRHFVLVDAGGAFEPLVMQAISKQEARRADDALREFVRHGRVPDPLAAFVKTNRELDLAAWKRERGDSYLQVVGFKPPGPRFERVQLPSGLSQQDPIDTLAQQLRPWLRDEKKISVNDTERGLFAAILIPADLESLSKPGRLASDPSRPVGIQYWSGNLADTALSDIVESTVNSELRRREYAARGLDPAAVRAIEQTRAPVTSLNPKKASGSEQVNLSDRIRQWLPSLFVYLLWVAIFAVSQMLLTSVIEEKSNRIIEVLLSSVTPGELMMGKLLGIAAVGLTMLSAWIAAFVGIIVWKASGISPAEAAAAASSAGGGIAQVPGDLASILQSTWLIPAFAIYFLFGYLQYAGLILALGSTCNTLKEAQNFMGVIVLFLLVPMFTLTYIPRDPNGPLAVTLSWIPPYTPFVMMNRVTADPPLRDVIGTFVLMLAYTALVLWGAGRIFRAGILRTGQPPRLLELLKWLRQH